MQSVVADSCVYVCVCKAVVRALYLSPQRGFLLVKGGNVVLYAPLVPPLPSIWQCSSISKIYISKIYIYIKKSARVIDRYFCSASTS